MKALETTKDVGAAIPEAPEQEARKAEAMRILSEHPFRPPWWLRNAHLQTVGARYVRRVIRPDLRVERWDTPDDDFIQLYTHEGNPEYPTAVLLHGLEGSIESTYFVGLIRALIDVGWSVAAVEFRSCSNEMNRACRMYHSGETEDLGFVVRRILEQRPESDIYVAGFSLGGNVTAKWFGENGDSLPLQVKGGAVVSVPFDLVASGEHMDGTWSRFYVWHFLRMLKPKAMEKHRQYPGRIEIEKVLKARTFREFDDHATARLHGFVDALDYYSKSGCGQYLPGVRRPLLLVSAADDPFNPGHTLPRKLAERHPYLHPLFPDKGGHVGFVGTDGRSGIEFWAERQIVRFFEFCRTTKAGSGGPDIFALENQVEGKHVD